MITYVIGDCAIARICKNVYSKVRIVKNEDGVFFDDKVLGISTNADGSVEATYKICYHVEICRSKKRIWLPWEHLRLAERSRPFYGRADKVSPPYKNNNTKKRKVHPDHTLPMNVKKHCSVNPDLNTTYDHRHVPKLHVLYENAFKEFVRRGKEMIFDELLDQFPGSVNFDKYWRFLKCNIPTEDMLGLIIEDIMTEKEIENHLYQCWRYNIMYRDDTPRDKEYFDIMPEYEEISPSVDTVKSPIVVHIGWCLVCGKKERLQQCPECPSSFHVECRDQWKSTILHRKNPPKPIKEQGILIREKKLSSTRTVRAYKKPSMPSLCPSCTWGPVVGYGDVVWQKLGHLCWWPARVLTPGTLPSCLVTGKHTVKQWPVQFYGTLNYCWSDASRLSLFLPSHTSVLEENRPEDLQDAVMDACDDYIAVYLT